MDKHNGIRKEPLGDYFSSEKENMQKLIDAMETKHICVEDDNRDIKIAINGKQKILSLVISAPLLESRDKKEILFSLMRIINQAIQQSNMNNLEELRNIISPEEFAEIISKGQKSGLDGSKKTENNLNQLSKELLLKRKSAISKSGRVKIIISGVDLLQSIEISDECLSIMNKEMVEREIIDTVNTLIQENIQEVSGAMENIGKEIYKFEKNKTGGLVIQ